MIGLIFFVIMFVAVTVFLAYLTGESIYQALKFKDWVMWIFPIVFILLFGIVGVALFDVILEIWSGL